MSRRIGFVITGSVLLILGGLVALSGGAMLAVFGSSDGVRSGVHQLRTPTYALVSSVAELDGVGDLRHLLGHPRVDVVADARGDGGAVFVGIGPASAVERYLRGVAVDEVQDLSVDPFQLDTVRKGGTVAPGTPAQQDFWAASAQADTGGAQLSWPVQDGDYRLVVMNADAAAGVDADGQLGVVLPDVSRLSVIVLLAGLVVALLGGAALVVGLRQQDPRPAAPAPQRVG